MTTQNYIPVRLSHLFYHSSVGAIVRTNEWLMAIRDIRTWVDRQGKIGGEFIPYVDQVRSALSITAKLYKPPVARIRPNGQIEGVCIPADRFPRWMICPICNFLFYYPWKDEPDGEKPHCRVCNPGPELEQVPWVLVHAAGYMADVDWHYLAHRASKSPEKRQCGRDNSTAYLTIKADQTKNGQFVSCTTCGAKSWFRPGTPMRWGRIWQQPWIYEPPELSDDSEGEIMPVNDVRIHETTTATAIVIPPESRIHRGSPLDKLYCNSEKRTMIDRARNQLARQSAINSVATDLGCFPRDIEDALVELGKGFPLYGQNFTQGLLLESEYKALCEPIEDVKEHEDFVPLHHTADWKLLTRDYRFQGRLLSITQAIDRLVALDRLRAVMVLSGFSRNRGEVVPPDIEGKNDWLPAIELFGEGVFFTLNESILKEWEENTQLQARAIDFKKRKEFSGIKVEPEIVVTPRFLLMHTLAHIIIRQLEAKAGYPAASLKERIYCRVGRTPMSGILVYVAVPDKHGSLGGLAEMAEPKRFLRLMKNVFDHADWCSLDPVCSEHEGQGPSQLNRAACHSCALIPETACSYKNILLDRIFISGQVTRETEGFPGFLSFVEARRR